MKNKIKISIIGNLSFLIVIGTLAAKYFKKKDIEKAVISPNRFEVGFHILSNWLKLKNEGKTLDSYFKDNEISTVAIYGVGALGERVFEELKSLDIKVLFAIDRIADSKNIEGLKIIGVDDKFEEVDVVIVTPVQDFYQIEEKLEQKTDADIISLEDIVNYCI